MPALWASGVSGAPSVAGAGRVDGPPTSIGAVIADVLTERGDQLHQLAARARAYRPTDMLPPHRILQLSALLLEQLAGVEREAHGLERWFRPAPPA
jgi:hypothetical protein